MNIAEFFVSVGLDVDKKAFASFKKDLSNTAKGFGKMAVMAGVAVFAVERFITSSVKGSVALRNFQNQTGQSIKELQKWQLAGVLSDTTLSFEQISSAIQSAQKNLTLFRLGGGDKSAYQMLGIAPSSNVFKVLEKLREKIKGLDNAMATTMIEKFGLPAYMINVLRLSTAEFEKLSKSSEEFLTKEDRDILIEMGTAMTDLGIKIGVVKDRMAVMLSKQLLPMVKAFNWLADEISFAGLFWDAFGHKTVKILSIILDIGNILQKTIITPTEKLLDKLDDKMGLLSNLSGIASGGIIGVGSGLAGNLKNTFNNTFHINTTADAGTVANKVVSKEQEQLNKALESINNGVVA